MSRCRILLFGKNGQIGAHLEPILSSFGTLITLGREDACLLNSSQIQNAIRTYRPMIIVNASAYTNVDAAEHESDLAYRVNAEGVRLIAEEAANLGAWFIHYSTDYVFDGSKADAYLETDQTHPLNTYGQTKLAGEQAIQALDFPYIILRSSWVYSSRRTNFPMAILKRAATAETLEVVHDSFGAPTHAALIADMTAKIIQKIISGWITPSARGIYHLTASGVTSWYNYAVFLIEEAHRLGFPIQLQSRGIQPIAYTAYPSGVLRPMNSQLNTQKIETTFEIRLPSWKTQVTDWMSSLHKEHYQ